MIWNPNKECMSRDQMHALQSKRLQKLVTYVYHNVPFYRNKMQAMDIAPEDITSIDDIVKLPFTTKQDLRDNYPYGLQAAPPSEIVRVHASSGTTGNTEKHIRLIRDLKISGIACTPSYALYLAETLEKMGLKKEDIGLRIGAFGAEPWTENMRKEIEERLGLKGYNLYGLSEIMGPGVSYECSEQCGSHINEDHFYPEIINPDTLEQLPYGEQGELVFTTLTKEGMPLLRYRTKDLCTLHSKECGCGRTSVKMGRIMGRSDDMLIIRGINVFPSQVESVILEMKEFEPQYMLIVDRAGNLDTLQVQVEVRRDFFSDDIGRMLNMKKHLADRLKSVLSIGVDVKLMEPGSIERSQGKGKHVIDKRILK